MKITLIEKTDDGTRKLPMGATVNDGDYDAALTAAIGLARHYGAGPCRVYTDEGEPIGVVTVALVESEADMEALGA